MFYTFSDKTTEKRYQNINHHHTTATAQSSQSVLEKKRGCCAHEYVNVSVWITVWFPFLNDPLEKNECNFPFGSIFSFFPASYPPNKLLYIFLLHSTPREKKNLYQQLFLLRREKNHKFIIFIPSTSTTTKTSGIKNSRKSTMLSLYLEGKSFKKN